MRQKTTFNATQARQNFFKLLKLVSQGREAVIIKKDDNVRFKITLFEEKDKVNKKFLLKKMEAVNLKSKPWKEAKKIIETRLAL